MSHIQFLIEKGFSQVETWCFQTQSSELHFPTKEEAQKEADQRGFYAAEITKCSLPVTHGGFFQAALLRVAQHNGYNSQA